MAALCENAEVYVVGMDGSAEAQREELERLLNSVIHKRKTLPKRCMDMQREIIRYEIKRSENPQIKEDNGGTQSFWKLVNKLKKSKPTNVSFDDLHDAENKLKKCYGQVNDIYLYLHKRKEYFNK